MKKIIFAIFLLLLSSRIFAPNDESLIIFYPSPVEPFNKLIYAIGMVESECDTFAYNPTEKAAGYFQIRPIRLEDYNKRTGSDYKMKDLFRYEISEHVFLYYAQKTGPYDFEKIARNWNGSGHKTTNYWNQIKQYL
jgi:hypothetical protein